MDPSPSNQPHVLLTDDDPFITALYRERLIKEGMTVATAQNGEEALESIQKQPPDLLLLDLNMPRMDGTEVLRYIREQSPCPNLPIVVLSNACAPEFIAEVSQLRPTRFLVKYDNAPNKVIETILTVLEEARASDVVAPAPADIHPQEFEPATASLEVVLDRLETATSIDEQRESVLGIYRAVQATLEHFQTLPPLSLPYLLEDTLEPLLEKCYALEQLIGPALVKVPARILHAVEKCAATPPTTSVPSSPVLLHVPAREQVNEWKTLLDRPGFSPCAVQQSSSAEDLLHHNVFYAVVWHTARKSAARKALRLINDRATKGRLHTIFVMPQNDADRWSLEAEAGDSLALGDVCAQEALPALLYALQAS